MFGETTISYVKMWNHPIVWGSRYALIEFWKNTMGINKRHRSHNREDDLAILSWTFLCRGCWRGFFWGHLKEKHRQFTHLQNILKRFGRFGLAEVCFWCIFVKHSSNRTPFMIAWNVRFWLARNVRLTDSISMIFSLKFRKPDQPNMEHNSNPVGLTCTWFTDVRFCQDVTCSQRLQDGIGKGHLNNSRNEGNIYDGSLNPMSTFDGFSAILILIYIYIALFDWQSVLDISWFSATNH